MKGVLPMNSQIKKGILDLCVLALLEKGDSYGYDLAGNLARKVEVADGTVYPILRKLASEGVVSTYLQESQNGPPRKYYHLTEAGRNKLNAERDEWIKFCGEVNGILKQETGGKADE
jgi:PadR family transcriptional regulator PadR